MPKHDPADLQTMIEMAQARQARARLLRLAQEERLKLEQDPAYWRGRIAGLEFELAEAREQLRRLELLLRQETTLRAQMQSALKQERRVYRPTAKSHCARCTQLQARITELEALWDDES